ncbi:inactive hydroxysteroid dehydrogenase-like protein 1 [Malaya genurostris]|uniref:inactive hydroxysteroid dehydrogenase-like protein 1 n=1 Tax=Malaya genurostris TaxID=325434 RepID=UPI0026F3C66C|nr:inactive hydroxysteroid dehydrogenase-like protein 1 [Malaya genurostris]
MWHVISNNRVTMEFASCSGSNTSTFLSFIGIFALTLWSYDTFKSLFGIVWGFCKQFFNEENFAVRYGQWAVISGGSDGIGRQYARFFARKGLNIVIIALPDEKLERTAEEIELTFRVQVRRIPADFFRGFELNDYLKQELHDLDVGILVNNVGMVHTDPAYFDTNTLKMHQQIINVNINAAVMLSHIILPRMKQNHRGLVINIASMAGQVPMPFFLMYSATKAFVTNFSVALQQELSVFGVECQTVTPCFVATNLTERLSLYAIVRLISADVETFGKFATMTVGKTVRTTGYWVHGLTVTALKFFPTELVTKPLLVLGKTIVERKMKISTH